MVHCLSWNIDASGIAILAFGSSGSGQGVRFARPDRQKRRHVDESESGASSNMATRDKCAYSLYPDYVAQDTVF
jgi:hypothetical protein